MENLQQFATSDIKRNIFLVLILSGAICVSTFFPPIAYLFLVLLVFFIMLIYPLLGVAIYIPVHLFLSGYYFLAFPVRYYVLAAMFITVTLRALFNRNRLKIAPPVKKMIVIVLLYLIWAFIRQVQYDYSILNAIRFFVGQIASGFLSALALYYICDTPKKVRTVFYILLGWVTLSAFVGMMQFLGVRSFIELGNLSLYLISDENARQELLLSQGKGVTGLMGLSLVLGYTTSYLIPIVLSFLLISQRSNRFVLSITLGLLIMGLVGSLVMSSIVGAIFAIAYVIYLNSKKRLAGIIIGSLLALVIAIAAQRLIPGIFADHLFDRDGMARIPLFLVGLKVSLANPFGISIPRYLAEASRFAGDVASYTGSEFVYTASPHNNYINVLTTYGFPGLIFYLLFTFLLWGILRDLLTQTESVENLESRPLALGFVGAFLVTFMNSFTHNAGLFMGETIAWFGIGILWALSTQIYNRSGETK